MHCINSWCLRILLLSPFVFSSLECAQFSTDDRHPILIPLSGQLESAANADFGRLRVQLWDAGARNMVAEAHLNVFGAFDLQASNGSYVLRIVNWHGTVIHSQSVSIPYGLTLRIPLGGEAVSGAARIPVSLARLQHKVPKKALKDYWAWSKSNGEKDRRGGIAHLEQALRHDPQFFEAANDLGVLYLQDGRLSEAYEMFQRATAIDEGDPQAEANLAYVLLSMRRYPEAEAAARSSVRADGLSGRGRYLLAVSLIEQRKSLKEALFHLTKARDEFEPARKLLLQLEGSRQR